jgi:hypothetical protein
MRFSLFVLVSVGSMIFPTTVRAQDLQAMLDAGQVREARQLLAERLADAPDSHDDRLALGVVTFLDGVQTLSSNLYRYGIRPDTARMLPMMRLPQMSNPDPDPISLAELRAVVERFNSTLVEVETTLEPIGDRPARMDLRIGTVRLDFDGDGQCEAGETLWRIYAALVTPPWDNQEPAVTDEQAESFVIGLDTADAYWLRGYCQLLSGVMDAAMAFDHSELFARTAHLWFAEPVTPYAWLKANDRPVNQWDVGRISDLVATIHLISFPLSDAGRMGEAHGHFERVVALSRQTWSAIGRETDDDNEWLPGPDQTSAIGVGMTAEQIDAWYDFLNEFEALLEGEKLLPFWRGDNPRLGVNLERCFSEPAHFDLVLWVQGTGADPFLEEGDVTEPGFWIRLNRDFGGNFPGFAFWIN